jgi:hypothetical protein
MLLERPPPHGPGLRDRQANRANIIQSMSSTMPTSVLQPLLRCLGSRRGMLLIVVTHRLMGLTMPINSTATLDMKQRSPDIGVRCALKWIARPIQHPLAAAPQALMPISLSRWTIDLLMIHTGQGLHCLLALSAVRHPLVVTIPPTTRTAKVMPMIVNYSVGVNLTVGIETRSFTETNINLLRLAIFILIALGYSKPILSHSPAQTKTSQLRVRLNPFASVVQPRNPPRTILMISPCAQMYRPSTGH